MVLTRSFLRSWCSDAFVDEPEFGAALLCEGIDTMLAGEVDTGKAICAIRSKPYYCS